MVDAFDFDGGVDALGMDAFDFDIAGFGGLGFGDVTGIAGFDGSSAFLDGMELSGVDGLEGFDVGELQLDLSFDSIGHGSDLDDILATPDPGQLIDLELAAASDLDLTTGDALAPAELSSLSPADAIGPGPLASPFLPEAAGGAVLATGAVAPSGMLLPAGLVNTPTDSTALPLRAGSSVAKLGAWLAKKGREVVDDLAKEAVGNQLKRSAKGLLAVIGGAAVVATGSDSA